MQGEDRLGGMSVFHRRFVSGPNLIGGLSDSDTPAQFGPRNCGHATAAETGKAIYEQERLEVLGQFWASPLAADGRIYFASTRGNIAVIEAADSVKVLARNQLAERIDATPAMADNKL